MKNYYLYINMLDITELQRWYKATISDIKNGTADLDELNRGYIKEDICAEEIVVLDGNYYSIVNVDNTNYHTVDVDIKKYKKLDEFEKLKEEFLNIQKAKEVNKGIISDKIRQATELVEQAESLADKYNLEMSWSTKYGTYYNGEWNSSSLEC